MNNINDNLKRAALFAQVSGDVRQNATSGIEGQLDLCREFIAQHVYHMAAELAEDDRRMTNCASWNLPQLKL